MSTHTWNPEHRDDTRAGLRRVPAPDVTAAQSRSAYWNTDDEVAVHDMLLRDRAIIEKWLARLPRKVAREYRLRVEAEQFTTRQAEMLADRYEALARSEAIVRALAELPRPMPPRRRRIGAVTSAGIVASETALAFAAATALLPRLSDGSPLDYVLDVAPFLFTGGVALAAYAGMEIGGTALAEVLQRRRDGAAASGSEPPGETASAEAPDELAPTEPLFSRTEFSLAPPTANGNPDSTT